MLEIPTPPSAGVNAVQTEGWQLFESIVDSGSAENVIPVNAVNHVPLEESPGSRSGQVFHSADGGVIRNQGQRTVPMMTDEGDQCFGRYQVGAVTKPLTAVSKITDQGNAVVFQQDGGYIYNLESGRCTWFPRERGVYVLRTWVWNEGTPSSDFRGQA